MKQYIGLEEMSNGNCASVLAVIRNCGALSRKQISDITGLSWGGMTKIVNKLTEHEYIIEVKGENGAGAGRTPGVLKVNDKKYYVIGLDINRAGFGAYVMNLCGDIIQTYEREVLISDAESLLSHIFDFTEDIMRDFENRQLLSVGIAMQGAVDSKRGISVSFPHCLDWHKVPLREMMSQKLGVQVFVEHDPNCMLYTFLSEEDAENMLLFRVDNSIGMAVSVEGRMMQGGGILEVAHNIVMPNQSVCKCGRYGCLESYLSPCLVKGKPQPEAIAKMIEPLAITMYNMANIFHSEKIILTGRLARHRAYFECELRSRLNELLLGEQVQIEIVEEVSQAVLGASLIAVQGAIDGLRL